MIPIYLCEDNTKMLAFVKGLIEKYVMINDYDMSIVSASTNPLDILEHRRTHNLRSIYFFDVDLNHPEYDGFKLAKELRSIDTRGFFIFVTTHEELIFETFKYRLEALSYLTKDDPGKLIGDIHECLDDIHAMIEQEQGAPGSYFTAKVGETSYQIPLEDILYFETSERAHFLKLYTQNRMLEFRGNLKETANELDSSFCMLHRSYLVQLKKIKSINYRDSYAEMINGSRCLISRKGKKLLKQ